MAGDGVCHRCGVAISAARSGTLCDACVVLVPLEQTQGGLSALDAMKAGQVTLRDGGDPTEGGDRKQELATIHDEATMRGHVGNVEEAATIAPAMWAEGATIPIRESAGEATQPMGTGADRSRAVRYFGDYELIQEIARGGMGVVYRARQVSLNRPVAIKMILAGQLASGSEVRRFQLEAEAAANLDHPGIVPIHEIGEHEGQHFFSMGFIDGVSLATRLADGPLVARVAAQLMRQVAEAVQYAHEHGVIHRDLKPANVLLDGNGRPKVTDFGLAKKLEGDSGLTGSGQIMGTPSYMPPEQAGSHRGEVGRAADVYSLGATLYALLTGRPPFQAATALDTVLMVLSDEPVPPRRLNASVPGDLETICMKCLEKDAAKRYESAEAFGEDLRRYLDGEPIVARPVTAIERSVKWARRRPAIAALGAATMLATVLGMAGIGWQWRKAEQNFLMAEEQRNRAETSAAISIEKAEALRRQDYISRVNLAYRECLDDNVTHALELLNGCPVDLRGWEWSYANRQCQLYLQSFREQAPVVKAVAFSPDNRLVVCGTGGFLRANAGDVVVRDIATGKVVMARRDLPGGVHAVCFSRDGRSVAAGYGATLIVLDIATGRELFQRSGGPVPIAGIAATPDGKRIVTAHGHYSSRGTVGYAKVWDFKNGTEVMTPIPGPEAGVSSLAISSDGQQVAMAGAEQVKVCDLETGKLIRTLRGHDNFIYSVAASPDGRYFASGGFDRTVRLWDAGTGAEVRRYVGHQGFVRGLAFSPDSRQLVSSAEDNSVKLWSVSSDRELATLHGHEHYVMAVAFSPDGHMIASGSVDQTVKLWFTTTTPQLTYEKHTGWVNSIGFSPDGTRVASSSGLYSSNGFVQVWDPITGEPIRSFPEQQSFANAVVFSPQGDKLAAACGDGTVQVWDVANGKSSLVVQGGTRGNYEPSDLAFSPDGLWLALGDDDSSIKMWDVATGKNLKLFKGHTAEVNGVAFSADGTRLASGSTDKTVRVWETATGREILRLEGHQWGVGSVAFSPDQRLVASVGGVSQVGGEVRVWDVGSGRLLYSPKGHSDNVSGVAFSPDGRRIATSSEDRTIKLWDSADGQEVFSLRGHTSGVLCVAFSRDGQRIASGSIDRTAKVWDTGSTKVTDLIARTTWPLIERLSQNALLKSELMERIHREPGLDDAERRLALQYGEHFEENPLLLNNTSWFIVVKPDAKAEDYARAERYAEAACRLAPKEWTFVNTLGASHYRVGRYQDALTALNRSLVLDAAQFGGMIPADLSFIAMTQQKMGKKAEAMKTLDQLHGVMGKKPWSDDAESGELSDEANFVVMGTGRPIGEVGRFEDRASGVTEFACFSPDGRQVMACSLDGIIRLWDRESGRLVRTLKGHEGRVRSVVFSPDGRRVLSGGQDKLVRLWDVESGKEIRALKGHTDWIFVVAFSPDGRRGYSTSGGTDSWTDGTDSAVREWDLESGREIRELSGHKGRVFGLAVSGNGQRVLSGGDDRLIFWNAENGKEIRRFSGHSKVISSAVMLAGDRRAVSGSYDTSIRLWDLETGKELRRFLGHPAEVTWVAASPDGRRLLSSDYGGFELRLWDVDRGRLIRRVGLGSVSPTRGSFSPDGKYAVWATSDGGVRLYELGAVDVKLTAEAAK